MREYVGWRGRLKSPVTIGVAAATFGVAMPADQARSVRNDPLPACSSAIDTQASWIGTRINRIDVHAEEAALPQVILENRKNAYGASVMRISTGPESGGTGFVAETSRNKRVIVTAGHVAAKHALSDFRVQSFDGRTVHEYRVDGGCLIRKTEKTETPADDIAILTVDEEDKLPRPLTVGSGPASALPGFSVNYQIDTHTGLGLQRDVRNPAVMTVVPIARANDMTVVASGIDGEKSEPLLPGASGSPVIQDDEVIGVAVRATLLPMDSAEQRVSGISGRAYNGYLVNNSVVEAALSSPELDS